MTLPRRADVPVDDTWAVESIFPSAAAFDAELAALTDLSANGKWPSLTAYRGTLSTAGAAGVVALLDEYFSISRRIQVLYTYGHLQHDTDTADDAKKAAYGRAVSAYYGFAEATSWVDAELVALPDAAAAALTASPEVAAAGYGFHLEKIFRDRAHTLSAEGEALIAMAGKSMGAATKAFGALNNADLKFEAIRDGKGDRHEVTLGNYIGHMRSRDRRRREAAFKSLYGAYGAHENTLAELLGGAVEKNVFTARARKYGSVLESALSPNGIPTAVYTSLLETVRAALPRTMHKYARLRRRLLHAQSPAVRTFHLHYWDLYAPLIPDVDIKFSYDAARAAVVDSVAPLGDEYQETVRAGLYEKRWVDRFENLNKRSGAYSSGCHDTQPFVLMNYQEDLDGIKTLAHELGHSAHSALSRATQPVQYSDYSIFIAEVASTFNEALLQKTLRATVSTDAERMMLVNAQLDDIRGTFFRQAQLADFELAINQAAEAKTPLTPGFLKSTYARIAADYIGPDVVMDKEIELEWSRIPHFHARLYVYQYATSLAASAQLADRVLAGKLAPDDYLAVLRGGGSVDPVVLLRQAGVDLETTAPFEAVCNQFESLVDELDALTAHMQPPPPRERSA